MKEKIISLRNEGKTYDEIKNILNCSKSTISYHCGEGQKEKSKIRQRGNRKKTTGIIKGKIDAYVRSKVRSFKNRNGLYGKSKIINRITSSIFSYSTAYDKIFNAKNCYLSGRKINLENSKSFHLDHITPLAKGGKNTLKNMGIARREANQAKGDLTIEEFIELCIDVCEYNGYLVGKKNNEKNNS